MGREGVNNGCKVGVILFHRESGQGEGGSNNSGPWSDLGKEMKWKGEEGDKFHPIKVLSKLVFDNAATPT